MSNELTINKLILHLLDIQNALKLFGTVYFQQIFLLPCDILAESGCNLFMYSCSETRTYAEHGGVSNSTI